MRSGCSRTSKWASSMTTASDPKGGAALPPSDVAPATGSSPDVQMIAQLANEFFRGGFEAIQGGAPSRAALPAAAPSASSFAMPDPLLSLLSSQSFAPE